MLRPRPGAANPARYGLAPNDVHILDTTSSRRVRLDLMQWKVARRPPPGCTKRQPRDQSSPHRSRGAVFRGSWARRPHLIAGR